MIHIGISGPIGVGKSTLANKIKSKASHYGYLAAVISFATGIRELVALEAYNHRRAVMAIKLFEWGYDMDKAQLAANLIDQYMIQYPSVVGQKNRRLLQSIGTEVGRDFLGADTWIYRVQQLARNEVLDFLISDDLRFDNEALAVDVHVGITIPEDRRHIYEERVSKYGAGYTYSNHASEQSLTIQPLLTIPIGYNDEELQNLFMELDHIRRLRY